MKISYYNEYYLPNNDFLYNKSDCRISKLKSKKNLPNYRKELIKKYGEEELKEQIIHFNGKKLCTLAFVEAIFSQSSISYICYFIQEKIKIKDYEPYSLDELRELFNTNTYIIHIWDHGYISINNDWVEFENKFYANTSILSKKY